MKNLTEKKLIEYLNIGVEAALKAGKVAKNYWCELSEKDVEKKSSFKDLVTIADKEAEKVAIAHLQKFFPEHSIIGEESGNLQKTDSDFEWAIDPIDGTTNFRHSYPFFCTSIGLLYKKEAIVGVVYNPVSDELFTAVKNRGAYLNGRPIRVSKTNNLEESLLVTGFAYRADELMLKSLDLFKYFNLNCHGVRRDGAAALDLCYVACGRLEGFWEYGLKVWDVTAGTLIVREAGGIVSDPFDSTHQSFDFFGNKLLATNGIIHDELAKKIRE